MPVIYVAGESFYKTSARRLSRHLRVSAVAGRRARVVDLGATAAWSRRVRRVGGLIQATFAAFWLLRGSLVLGGDVAPVLIAVFGVTVIAVFSYAVRATARIAPRPKGPAAKRIERDVTLATVIQLVASFALPYVVVRAGHSDWVLPSIAVTIGPLLLWLDRRVDVPRYRPVGLTLILAPVILVALTSGTPLIATTGIAAGLLLLGTAVAGFRDLAGARRRTERANVGGLIVGAGA
jgi:hypothetical protein